MRHTIALISSLLFIPLTTLALEISAHSSSPTTSTSNCHANGSGVIIAKDGNTYTVLTASHVVCEREDATKPCPDYKYTIRATDGKQYPVDKSTIKTEGGVDLAVVKFTTPQTYQVATLADYNPNEVMKRL